MNKPMTFNGRATEHVVRAPAVAALAMIDRLIAFPTVSRDSISADRVRARGAARLGVRETLSTMRSPATSELFATLS